MIQAVGPFSSGLAVGGAGVATAETSYTTLITGLVLGVYLKYTDTPPATTDTVISAINGAFPDMTLFSHSNENTDGMHLLGEQVFDALLGTVITGVYHPIPVVRHAIKVAIAQANANDEVSAWIIVDTLGVAA